MNVRVDGFSNTDLELEVTSFHFTPTDWNTEQTVTVTATSRTTDAVDDKVILTHTAKDGEYQGVTKELPVTVDDDEETEGGAV